jgi:NAD dependent epimerase/dehydratase family enzyme
VNAVAPGIVTNAALTLALGDVLGRPTLLPVPAIALRFALGELSGELLGSRRALPRAALERGFRFTYPDLAPALREELQPDR